MSAGSEKSQGMSALAISANRRYLAVSQRGEQATITVLDLHHEQGRKRKVLTAGDTPVQDYVCMAFSADSKYLIGQTGPPEWTLIFWLWEKHKVLATAKTTSPSNAVSQVSVSSQPQRLTGMHALIVFRCPIRSASTLSTTCSSV